MPTPETRGLLTDIGTEELAHLEMVGAIVYQLTRDIDSDIVKKSGFGDYFINHANGIYPANSNGSPFNAMAIAVTADPITDLHESMAAEQKARSTYDNILRLADDPDVIEPIKFLRQREVVHYQRFGEANHTNLRSFFHTKRHCNLFRCSVFFLFRLSINKSISVQNKLRDIF